MSIVGPRPERPEIAAMYEEELPELWSIAYEIGRIEAFVDMLNMKKERL